MVDKLVVSHIERPALPWRTPEQQLTECGLPTNSYPTITRDETRDRLKEWGEQRTRMNTCVTCFDTANRWATWEYDPLDAIERAVNSDRRDNSRGGYWRRNGLTPTDIAPNSPLRADLRAIAILIERHRDEFDRLLIGLSEVVDLSAKRRETLVKKKEARRSTKW